MGKSWTAFVCVCVLVWVGGVVGGGECDGGLCVGGFEKECERLVRLLSAKKVRAKEIERMLDGGEIDLGTHCVTPGKDLAKMDGTDMYELPPLHTLLSRQRFGAKHLRLLGLLLDAGADVNAEAPEYGPPLVYALGLMNPSLSEDVLNERSRAKEALGVLLARGADPNVLSSAVGGRLLYHERREVTEEEKLPPLHLAVLSGQAWAVEALLDAGANVENIGSGELALPFVHLAVLLAGNPAAPAVLGALLDRGADPLAVATRWNMAGRTALHLAAVKGSVEMVEQLLNAAGDVDELLAARDELGYTALDLAMLPPAYRDVADVIASYSENDVDAWVRPSRSFGVDAPYESQVFPRGGWKWQDEHPLRSGRCEFDIVDAGELSLEEFRREYEHLERPVILRGNVTSEWAAWEHWRRDYMRDQYGKTRLTGGPVPYGSRVFGKAEKQLRLDRFIDKMATVDDSTRTPWILFDRDVTSKVPGFEDDFEFPEYFGLVGRGSVQLSLGSERAGAPMHHHLEAWNAVVFGAKLWWLVPPSRQARAQQALSDEAGQSQLEDGLFTSGTPSSEWVETRVETRGRDVLDGVAFECEQRAGDVIYVPRLWSHTTINLADTVSIATEFINEPLHEQYTYGFQGYRMGSFLKWINALQIASVEEEGEVGE